MNKDTSNKKKNFQFIIWNFISRTNNFQLNAVFARVFDNKKHCLFFFLFHFYLSFLFFFCSLTFSLVFFILTVLLLVSSNIIWPKLIKTSFVRNCNHNKSVTTTKSFHVLLRYISTYPDVNKNWILIMISWS